MGRSEAAPRETSGRRFFSPPNQEPTYQRSRAAMTGTDRSPLSVGAT
jgi:hypothetical protein